jgi:hypothetical protein
MPPCPIRRICVGSKGITNSEVERTVEVLKPLRKQKSRKKKRKRNEESKKEDERKCNAERAGCRKDVKKQKKRRAYGGKAVSSWQ